MRLRIWLDDIRPIPEIYSKYPVYWDETIQSNVNEATVQTKSVNATKSLVEKAEKSGYYSEYIFDLDHDLGSYAEDGGDAIKFVLWLIETGRTGKQYRLMFHTANPVGRDNMKALYDRYFENGDRK